MIKNIIFDLGNVIVKNPNIDTVKKFFKDEKEAIAFNEYIFKSNFWKMMDLGAITNSEVANNIKENKLIDVKDFEEVENFMLNWFTKCEINSDTMELGKKLKEKGYKIYILSNMAKATFSYFSKNYNFFSIADGTIISADEGIKKSDENIFKILLERYSLKPEECLMIDDDDTNRTLEVANLLGINGRRVKANDTDDVKRLLEEYGVNVIFE